MLRTIRDFFISRLFAVSTILGGLILAGLDLMFIIRSGGNWSSLDSIVEMIASFAVGWILSVYLVYQVLWRLLLEYRRRVGRSIVENCRVRILRGPHKNEIRRVYELWDSRGQVRVDLGEDLKNKVEDVLFSYQVERVD